LEIYGGVLFAVVTVVERRDGPRRLHHPDDDDDVLITARVLASQAEAIIRPSYAPAKHSHKLLNGGQATKWRN